MNDKKPIPRNCVTEGDLEFDPSENARTRYIEAAVAMIQVGVAHTDKKTISEFCKRAKFNEKILLNYYYVIIRVDDVYVDMFKSLKKKMEE